MATHRQLFCCTGRIGGRFGPGLITDSQSVRRIDAAGRQSQSRFNLPASSSTRRSMRRSAFFIRVIGIGILFHVYIGVRLIPAAPVGAPLQWLAVLALVASCLLIPLGMAATSASTA